ncbi:hypothetical protein Tco_1570205 [Tanacetum coccineum]
MLSLLVIDTLLTNEATSDRVHCPLKYHDNHGIFIEQAMTGVMTELILRECIEKAQAKSSLAKPKIYYNAKIELSKEHLKELRINAYSGSEEEYVVDHIAKVLEILVSIKIKILNVDTDRLHVHVFPFSLTGVARKWWIDEGNDKITAWSEVVRRFFCKYYPLSRTGKYDVTRDDEDEGSGYLEFIIWLNSKCKDHKSMDGTTKSALWHYWLKEEGNNEPMDEIESSDKMTISYGNGLRLLMLRELRVQSTGPVRARVYDHIS